jgi:hypothetical protein
MYWNLGPPYEVSALRNQAAANCCRGFGKEAWMSCTQMVFVLGGRVDEKSPDLDIVLV